MSDSEESEVENSESEEEAEISVLQKSITRSGRSVKPRVIEGWCDPFSQSLTYIIGTKASPSKPSPKKRASTEAAENESSDEELDNLLAEAYARRNEEQQKNESEKGPTATARRSKSPPKKPRYYNLKYKLLVCSYLVLI